MKRQSFKLFLVIHLLTCIVAQAQSIKDLEFLIGKWEHVETIFPGTDREYQEKGQRECSYVLEGTYIQCISKSENPKGKRTSWFLINYQKDKNYFKVSAYFSDYDFDWNYKWYLDKDAMRVNVISETKPNSRQFFRSFITFKSHEMLWEGYRSRFNEEKEWVLEFRETSKKVER